MTSPACNLEQLDDLVGALDPAARLHLLQLYLQSQREVLEQLDLARAAASSQDAAFYAHRLKSSARSIGAEPLVQICEALEKMGQLAFNEDCARAIDAVCSEAERVEQFILARSERESAAS